MKRLEGSKRRLDGSLVDVCHVDFYGFLCKYSRRFYMLLCGAGVGLNKVPFVHIMDF